MPTIVVNNKIICTKHIGCGVYEFPTLYKYDKLNRLTYHKIKVESNKVFVSRGIVNMKESKYPQLETSAKNIGKKNETTPHQQALLEAQSKWDAKINKQGFTTTQDGCGSNTAIFPMLANKFTKKFSKYPVNVSPKIDGCRCLATLERSHTTSVDDVKLCSRTTREFFFLNTIREHLLYILDEVKLPSVDGELYNHSLPFTQITSIVRQTLKKNEQDNLLEYWIFDIPDDKITYTDRVLALQEAENIYNQKVPKSEERVLKFIYSEIANSLDDVKNLHDFYIDNGYEGAIIRIPNSKYEFSRSKNLLKYKEFEDTEFKVVDAIGGKGLDKGAVVFVCETGEGKRFNVRPRGTIAKRRWQLDNKNIYIGKMLTVRYQNTGIDTDKVLPRFGVGVGFTDKNIIEAVDFRDYE